MNVRILTDYASNFTHVHAVVIEHECGGIMDERWEFFAVSVIRTS